MEYSPSMKKEMLIRTRKRHGLTQAAMAQRLGIKQSYLSRLELGRRAVSRRIELELLAFWREMKEPT
jgi:transcriptional regulator with XRE-family HTH domain